MTIEIKCETHLQQVRDFADTLGKEVREDLEKNLSYLEHYAGDTCVCELFWDMSPRSFTFQLYKIQGEERVRWMNGGLIFYQPRETGVGGPQFSVDLGAVFGSKESEKPRWSIHT
jgi:hypothetical protein